MAESAVTRQPSAADAGSRTPIELSGWTIEGVSVAGQETCILLPKLRVAFDIGRCPQRSVSHEHLFISHGHLDHIGGIPFHVATRALIGQTPSKIYGAPQCCDAARAMLDIHSQLEGETLEAEIRPLEVGGEVPLLNQHLVRPFRTVHVVPSQGYLVYSRKNKLRPEFHGASQQDIVAAKRSGTRITDTIETPEVAFTGDTSIDFVTLPGNDDVFRARLLIIECTFLDDAVDRAGARARGHMHVDDLAEHADKLQNEAILLIHFSARHKPQEVLDALDSRLPPALRSKCYPFLEGFSLR